MLTQAQRAIITATVPILEQGGETLTRHFYKNLFRDHPEGPAGDPTPPAHLHRGPV